MYHELREIKEFLLLILKNQKTIIMNLDDVLAKVRAEKTVDDSIVTLLTSVNQQLKDALANNDQGKLQQISDQLDANTQEIAAAVAANTPAANAGGDAGAGAGTGTGASDGTSAVASDANPANAGNPHPEIDPNNTGLQSNP